MRGFKIGTHRYCLHLGEKVSEQQPTGKRDILGRRRVVVGLDGSGVDRVLGVGEAHLVNIVLEVLYLLEREAQDPASVYAFGWLVSTDIRGSFTDVELDGIVTRQHERVVWVQ